MIRSEHLPIDVESPLASLEESAGSQLELVPKVSDVRCLVHGTTAEQASHETREGWRSVPSGSLGLGELLAFADEELGKDSDVARALRFADLLKASWLLLSERKRLVVELGSTRADFDELRAMSAADQEQWTRRWAVADDERVALMERLERAVDEIVALEMRLVEAQGRINTLEGKSMDQV
jgi:hypothetical protein